MALYHKKKKILLLSTVRLQLLNIQPCPSVLLYNYEDCLQSLHRPLSGFVLLGPNKRKLSTKTGKPCKSSVAFLFISRLFKDNCAKLLQRLSNNPMHSNGYKTQREIHHS